MSKMRVPKKMEALEKKKQQQQQNFTWSHQSFQTKLSQAKMVLNSFKAINKDVMEIKYRKNEKQYCSWYDRLVRTEITLSR